MKPEELRGRELAAYLSGLIEADRHEKGGGFDINRSGMILAAAEIERLCAEPRVKDGEVIAFRGSKPTGPLVLIEESALESAARDAAALDELRDLYAGHFSGQDCPQHIMASKIIERTGRKIGP